MFSSINLLFLSSLGVTSWIILCYLKHIENALLYDTSPGINVEVSMEQNFANDYTAGFCMQELDIYLNFVCIFACIYALAKISQLAEAYLTDSIRASTEAGKKSAIKNNAVEQYRSSLSKLMSRINSLEATNSQLEMRLKQLQQNTLSIFMSKITSCSCQATGQTGANGSRKDKLHCADIRNWRGTLATVRDDDSFVSAAGNEADSEDNAGGDGWTSLANSFARSQQQQQRIISDRHLEISSDTYDENDTDSTSGTEQSSSDSDQSDSEDPAGFRNVWPKYLEMQRSTIRRVASVAQTHSPVVVSTEELEVMHGIFSNCGHNI